MPESVAFWSFVTAILTLGILPSLGFLVRRLLARRDEAATAEARRYEQAIAEARQEVEKVSERYVEKLEESMETKARLAYQEKLLERCETEETRLRGELEGCVRERERLRPSR